MFVPYTNENFIFTGVWQENGKGEITNYKTAAFFEIGFTGSTVTLDSDRDNIITAYIDGKEVFRRENDRFHRPLHVTFDCEIMYSWVGEPEKGGLPQVFSIDWFKYRPLTKNSKDL